MAAPSLRKFSDLVKRDLMYTMKNVSEKQIIEYLDLPSVRIFIEKEYDNHIQRYEKGKVGDKGFKVGCISATSYNLYMLYPDIP